MNIKLHLNEMMSIVNKLENLVGSDNHQPIEQSDCIDIIKINIEHLQSMYPLLLELLQDRSPYEAVRQMSTEWRTPFVPVIVYSQLIQKGHFGAFPDDQLKLFKQLEELAKQIKTWSDTPHPE